MGLGALPAAYKRFLGMLGMHGTYEANWAMHDCDFMLNIGARFDDRVTGRISGFSPHSQKVHADIDPSSINKNVQVDLPIVGDAGAVLKALLAEMEVQFTTCQVTRCMVGQIRDWRNKNCLAFDQSDFIIKRNMLSNAFVR